MADERPSGALLLADPTWVAAQVAYLRDVEFLKGKGGASASTATGAADQQDDEAGDGARRPRRPRKPKGDKGAQQ